MFHKRSIQLRLLGLGLALACSICRETLAVQQPAPNPQPSSPAGAISPTVIRVRVNQVLVPVIVTDRKGHHVTGLKQGDFEVLEDGVPQKLVSFNTEESGAAELFSGPAAGPGGLLDASQSGTGAKLPRQTYIVCLDTLNSSFADFNQIRGALRKLFKEEQSADSQYALVALGRQPAVIQNLTPDAGQVLAAIESKDLTRAIERSESTNLAYQEWELSSMLGEYCQRCACAGAATASADGQVCTGKWQKIELWAGSAAQERDALTRSFLHDLLTLVEQLSVQHGKRTLVFVSDGFNLRPGRDLFGLMAAYAGDPGELLHDPAGSLEPELQAIIRLAASRNVTFYTLDSRGLSGTAAGGFDASGEYEMTRVMVLLPKIQQDKEMAAHENQDALGELAAATGGVFYRNSNDLFKGLRQSFADGREYYLLAYAPAASAADGKFREIKVQVRAPNLVVRAKRGYWAPTNE
jgi:VWFA-related protein